MLEKFWPLVVLIIVGLLALVVLDPFGGGSKKEKGKEKGAVAVDEPGLEELEKVDLVVGEGKEAKTGDRIEVHYVGTLRSTGHQFDASRNRGEAPYTFTLGRSEVIKGWDLGVVGMKEGGTRKLSIPGRLARSPSVSLPIEPGLAPSWLNALLPRSTR